MFAKFLKFFKGYLPILTMDCNKSNLLVEHLEMETIRNETDIFF